MKRTLTLIIALMALVVLSACEPEEKKGNFNPDNLPQTRWEGDLKFYDGGRLKSTSEVTIRFDSLSEGKLFQKRSGSSSKESYDFSYTATGSSITFDCPVINGRWSVSDYNSTTMKLTLEPSRNGVMVLAIK